MASQDPSNEPQALWRSIQTQQAEFVAALLKENEALRSDQLSLREELAVFKTAQRVITAFVLPLSRIG